MSNNTKGRVSLVIYVILFSVILFIGIDASYNLHSFNPLLVFFPKPIVKDTTCVPTQRDLEKTFIRLDIDDIGTTIGLSDRQKNNYLLYVDSASLKYQIPPILLHCIIYCESSYDPSVQHEQIYYNKKPTRAIGLTGIVWEYWKDSLKINGIVDSKLELTEPKYNIYACAYILRNNIQRIVFNNNDLNHVDVLDEIVRKYYGAYNEDYKQRIIVKVKDMAAKQWIKRLSKDILTMYVK